MAMERPCGRGRGLCLFQAPPACPREPVASLWVLITSTDVHVGTVAACRSPVWGGGHCGGGVLTQ